MHQIDLLLLQINDPLFPLGAYSHSFGLETYVQKGIVCDKERALSYIKSNIANNLLYTDFLAVRLSYEYASLMDLDSLVKLDELLHASRLSREIREASIKLGSRFIKNVSSMIQFEEDSIFKRYISTASNLSGKGHFALIYGLFCADRKIDIKKALLHYAYAQTSGTATNCVKLIPLSQTDGQILLRDSFSTILKAIEELKNLTIDDLARSAPGFELRSMQHETLYSRLYMSQVFYEQTQI